MIKWFISTKKGRLIIGVVFLFIVAQIWLSWRSHQFVDHFCQATIKGNSLSHSDVVLVRDDLLKPLKEELKAGIV